MSRRKLGLHRSTFSVRDMAQTILTAAAFERIIADTNPELREAVRQQIYDLLLPSVRAEVDANVAKGRVQ